MKTILVLTDLSKKAQNAAIYALKIAEKTHANIILYHSFEKLQSVSVPESGSWVYEDSETANDESLTELKNLQDYLASYHEPGAFKPEVSLLNEYGIDLASNVNQVLSNKKVDLIVMGTKGNDKVSHMFYSSEACAMIEHVAYPILFVPENCGFYNLKTIVFSNDLKKVYEKPVSFLVDFARIDNSQIILTHFGEYENNAHKCLSLIKDKLEYPNATSRLFPLENLGEQLREFTAHVQANLVVLIHHKQDLFENFIYGSDSKSMLKHNQVPLLILPG